MNAGLFMGLALVQLRITLAVKCESIDVVCQNCPAVVFDGNSMQAIPAQSPARAWLMGSINSRNQICGSYLGTFFPMLEFDAYRVYTGQWRAGYEGQLPVFTWGNGTSISPTRFPLGLRLPEVGHDACIGARTPDCDSLTTPFLTTRVVRSNALSSRAILDFFIIADVPDAPHHVATSMAEGIHWNLFVEHVLLHDQLHVNIEITNWRTGNGASTLGLNRWYVERRPSRHAGPPPMHVVVVEGDEIADTSTLQVFINGQVAIRIADEEANATPIRSLRLLGMSRLDIGASRNLSSGTVNRRGGFRLIHVEAVAAVERVFECQVALMMQDAQHRWDMWSEAAREPLTMLLWDSSHNRTSLWYPHTWAQVLVMRDGRFGMMTVIHTFFTDPSNSSEADAQPADLRPDHLIIATCHSGGEIWQRTPPLDCHDMAVAESLTAEHEPLSCGNSSAGGVLVQSVSHCTPFPTAPADAVQSMIEARLQEYGQAHARDAQLTAFFSTTTAVAGAATNVGISHSMGLVAANAGELGMSMLSGGASMGISALVSGLQWLSMTARLPVRHCRLMYSLSAGTAWASMDVIGDTSDFNQHDPVVLVYAAKLHAEAAATEEASSTDDVLVESHSIDQGHKEASSQLASGGGMPRHGHRRLQTVTDSTLEAAREAAGVVEAAWTLGYVRLIVLAAALVAVVAVHSVILMAWEHVGAVYTWPLPRMLVFPRLEALVILAMATAIGEAAGLLFVTASAGSTSVAVLAAVLYGCFVATAGYTMVVFIQHRSCHGLHYFAGVSDWKHAKGERGGYLWQTLLYDRIHGFWSPGSQVRPADLEPSRTCRHASGNVSIPAAVRVLIKLVQLMSHRARVQKLYLSMVQTELVAVRTNSQHRRRRSVVNMHGSVPMSSADAALAAGSIRPQRVTPHLSKQLSLVQHSSLVQLVQQSPMLEARPTAEAVESSDASATGWSGCCRGGSARHDAPEKLVYHPAALQVFSTAQLGPAACLCTHRKSFEDADSSQWLVHGSQHVCPDAVDTETCSSDDGGDRDCHGRAVGEAAGDSSVLSDVHESGFTNDLPMRRRVASMTKGSRGAKLSMGMRQSSLLRIPLSMELMDGWTAGLELELASTAVEVLDRFGVFFERQRGHRIGPMLHVLIQQVFLFTNGFLVGVLSKTEPGSIGAWVGLSVVLVLKVTNALVVTALRPHVDLLDVLGEACAAWLNVGTCICMLALQPYYKQDLAIADDELLADVLAGGGFATGTEGRLQVAVLVLSVLSLAASMLGVWGFVFLRLLAMRYVKSKVEAISNGTRASVQPRALEVPGVSPDLQVHLAHRTADVQQQLRRVRSNQIDSVLSASPSMAADVLASALPPLVALSNAPSTEPPDSSKPTGFHVASLAAQFMTRLTARSVQQQTRVAPSSEGPFAPARTTSGSFARNQGGTTPAIQASVRRHTATMQQAPAAMHPGLAATRASSLQQPVLAALQEDQPVREEQAAPRQQQPPWRDESIQQLPRETQSLRCAVSNTPWMEVSRHNGVSPKRPAKPKPRQGDVPWSPDGPWQE